MHTVIPRKLICVYFCVNTNKNEDKSEDEKVIGQNEVICVITSHRCDFYETNTKKEDNLSNCNVGEFDAV